MSNYRFICNHCGKSFQLETPTAKECPFCFWASSVKREDEAAAEKKRSSSSAPNISPALATRRFVSSWMFLLKGIFFLALLAGICFLGYQLYSKWADGKKTGAASISVKDIKKSQTAQDHAASLIAQLAPEEKSSLYRELALPKEIEPSSAEKQILDRPAEFKTGWSEKLPSPIWTLEQYQQMIKEQEQFYKIPFARSYRKKLEELFKTQYLPAGDAFAKGDLLGARNFWVGSLAIPLYSTDIKKHRSVALTMLKPFINDTIAKIGALNQALVVKEKRAQEGSVSIAYQGLAGLIAQKKWAEAGQAIDQLGPVIDQLEAAAKQQVAPPPYPPAIAMIDQDIQRVLADLLAPNPVSVANLLGLKQDLAEKRDVLMGLIGEQIKVSERAYQNALALIREKKWEEALSALGSVQGPGILRDDAQAKMVILRKITGERLDSPEKAG